VNGEVITLSEWNNSYEVIKERIEKGYKGPNKDQILAEAREATLNRLINSKLIELESKKAGIAVKEEEINAAIRDMISKQKMTLEDLRRNLAREGATLEQYKEDIRENMTGSGSSGGRSAARSSSATRKSGNITRPTGKPTRARKRSISA
jgi:peptidyl-prolyl cis-trans isomerase SurA